MDKVSKNVEQAFAAAEKMVDPAEVKKVAQKSVDAGRKQFETVTGHADEALKDYAEAVRVTGAEVDQHDVIEVGDRHAVDFGQIGIGTAVLFTTTAGHEGRESDEQGREQPLGNRFLVKHGAILARMLRQMKTRIS